MTRRPATHGDPEERRRAVDLYLSGVASDSVGEILEAEGWARRSGDAVRRWVREAGHAVRRWHTTTPEQRAAVVEALARGSSLREAARAAGVSRDAARYARRHW